MKDAFEKQLDNEEQTKSVAHTYAENRDCSIQESVKWSFVKKGIP